MMRAAPFPLWMTLAASVLNCRPAPMRATMRAVVPSETSTNAPRGFGASWLWIQRPRGGDGPGEAAYGERALLRVEHERRVALRRGIRIGSAQSTSQTFLAVLPRGPGWRLIRRGRVDDVSDFLAPLPEVDPTIDDRIGRGAGRVVRLREGAAVGLSLPLPGHRCLDAAFSDDRRGVAVMEPGRAFRTEDGGARWVELRSGLYSDAVAIAGHRWVLGRDGCLALDDAANVSPVDCRVVDAYLPHPTFEVDGAGYRAPSPPDVLRPATPEQLPVDHALMLDEHLALLGTPEGIVEFDLRTGMARRRADPPLPCVAGETAERLVHQLPAVRCESPESEGKHRFTLWRHDGDRWLQVMSGRSYWGNKCHLREDGGAAVCGGACGADPTQTADNCVREGVAHARTVRGQFDSVFAGWLRGAPVFVNRREWRWSRGEESPRPLLGPGSVEIDLANDFITGPVIVGRDDVMRLQLSQDLGSRVGTRVIEGEPGGRFVLRADERSAPPEGSPRVGRSLSVCGNGGIVVRRSSRGLELSTALGQPWRPLLSPEDPSLRRWLLGNLSFEQELGCDGAGVDLRYARSIGWGPLQPRFLGPAQPAQGFAIRRVASSVRCEPPYIPPPADPSIDAEPTGRYFGDLGGLSRLVQRPERPDRGVLTSPLGPTAVEAGHLSHEVLWPEELSSTPGRAAVSALGFAHDRASFLTVVERDSAVHLTLLDAIDGQALRRARRWRLPVTLPTPSPFEVCAIVVNCRPQSRTEYFGRVEPLWRGNRSLAVVSLPPWRRDRVSRVLLIDHEIGGAVRDGLLEIEDAQRVGLYEDGAYAGVAFEDTEGVVWGMDTTGARRRLAPAISWEPCPTEAHGTIVLPVVVEGQLRRPIARGEFSLRAGSLCLRRVVDNAFVMEPSGERWRARYIASRAFVAEAECARWPF